MSVSGFITNYTGRVVDLAIIASIPPTAFTPAVLNFSNPASVVAGPQKAAQQWLVMFLTRKGTVVNDLNFGTDFVTQLLTNQLRDDLFVEQAFQAAADDIKTYTTQNSTGNESPDEVVTAAALLTGWGWEAPDNLNLRVGLTLQSGAVTEVLVPIPVVIV